MIIKHNFYKHIYINTINISMKLCIVLQFVFYRNILYVGIGLVYILYSKYFLWILSEPWDCRGALNDTRMVENRA